jgi:hypothetical protein
MGFKAALAAGVLRTLVPGISSLTSRLGQVPAAVRAEIYAPLGVRSTYNPASASVEAEASRSHEMLEKTTVRGATRFFRTRLHWRGRIHD